MFPVCRGGQKEVVQFFSPVHQFGQESVSSFCEEVQSGSEEEFAVGAPFDPAFPSYVFFVFQVPEVIVQRPAFDGGVVIFAQDLA